MCHLPVCYIQPIYLSESERKSDGQCEQAVTLNGFCELNTTFELTATCISNLCGK